MTEPEEPTQHEIVTVYNLVDPGDSTASVGDLPPIDFVGGVVSIERVQAEALIYASPIFSLEPPPPAEPEGDPQSAPPPPPPSEEPPDDEEA